MTVKPSPRQGAPWLAALIFAALLTGTPVPAQATTVLLLDTFSDDTAGALPNGAEVGSAVYPGLSVPATTTTDYRVFNDGGNQRLRVTSPGPAGADNGSLIDYFPTALAPHTRVSYRYRIETGAAMVGLNAFGQELVMSPFGVNLELLWANDGHWHVGTTDVGAGFFSTADTGFAYVLGQDYDVTWLIDGAAGVFSVLMDGVAIVNNQAHVPMGGVQELAFFNNFNSTGAQVIDDVTITTVPEPSSAFLVALALVALGYSARGRPGDFQSAGQSAAPMA